MTLIERLQQELNAMEHPAKWPPDKPSDTDEVFTSLVNGQKGIKPPHQPRRDAHQALHDL